jgi:MFS-type transporter involved in bile tolerance (Atg22 family)
MSWIPLVFASLGAFGGGYVSDRLAGNKGVKGRLIILIASCVSYIRII